MGTVVLPKLNQTGTNEWADVEDNDKALRDEFNGNIENVNIKSTAAIAHSKLANATAGYILLANASGVITGTAVTGDVTISSSGVTSIGAGKVTTAMRAAVPTCVLSKADSLASSNSTKESWATEVLDTNSMHSTSVNTSRITIQTAGLYLISASLYGLVPGSITPGDALQIGVYVNGVLIEHQVADCLLADEMRGELNLLASLAASSYLEVLFTQNTGGSITMTKRFSATYLSAAS